MYALKHKESGKFAAVTVRCGMFEDCPEVWYRITESGRGDNMLWISSDKDKAQYVADNSGDIWESMDVYRPENLQKGNWEVVEI